MNTQNNILILKGVILEMSKTNGTLSPLPYGYVPDFEDLMKLAEEEAAAKNGKGPKTKFQTSANKPNNYTTEATPF